MFTAMADDKSKANAAYAAKVSAELDALLGGGMEDPSVMAAPPGQRTVRRRKRVEKTIAYQGDDAQKQDEEFNPADFSMLSFAEKYFSEHPKVRRAGLEVVARNDGEAYRGGGGGFRATWAAWPSAEPPSRKRRWKTPCPRKRWWSGPSSTTCRGR